MATVDGPRSLIARCAQGDETAFDEVFRRYGRDIYRIAWRMTGSHDDADDVLQETFIRAFQRLQEVDRDANIKRWLLTIAINMCIDRRRRRRTPVVALSTDLQSPSPGPEADMLKQELAKKLSEAISLLSGRQRACFVLHEMEDRKVEDIASTLGCSSGAVKSYLHRARETLRKELAPYIRGA